VIDQRAASACSGVRSRDCGLDRQIESADRRSNPAPWLFSRACARQRAVEAVRPRGRATRCACRSRSRARSLGRLAPAVVKPVPSRGPRPSTCVAALMTFRQQGRPGRKRRPPAAWRSSRIALHVPCATSSRGSGGGGHGRGLYASSRAAKHTDSRT
jgi:hypothetical protein